MDLGTALHTISDFFSARVLKETDIIKLTLIQMQMRTDIVLLSLHNNIVELTKQLTEVKELVKNKNKHSKNTKEVATNTDPELQDTDQKITTHQDVSEKFQNDQMKANFVAKLVQDKFSSFKVAIGDRRRVIAGIAMTRDNIVSATELIAVTMGTKCIVGKNICWKGQAIKDMHAEIISRRALIKYFYDQMDLLTSNQEHSSIFTSREDKKGYRLKEGIEFHLYIDINPCGDAQTPVTNQFVRFLRMKIESGEGNLPLISKINQSWEQLLNGGDLLKTMSCSDKICMWNVVGLQGALLSHFLEPIYLKSIIIGDVMSSKEKLQRALYKRIESSVENLQQPYRLNQPGIFLSAASVKSHGKGPNTALIWSKGNDQKYEVVITKKGLPLPDATEYCKREFFKRFTQLRNKLLATTPSQNDATNTSNYYETKEAAHSYKMAKRSVHEAFQKRNLGYWISKPIEHEIFIKLSSEDFLVKTE